MGNLLVRSVLATLALTASASPGRAQVAFREGATPGRFEPQAGSPEPPRHEWTVSAEPWAAGVQYLYQLGGPVRAGLAVTAGPFGGVTLARGTTGELREWATAYLAVGLRSTAGVEAILNPIGLAVVVGNDFGTVYPSAQGQLGIARRRLRLGSIVRVIRIAGGHGTGLYRWQWIPLRIGYAWGR